MIINNSPFGFTQDNESCDCRADNYCLPLVKEDNPVFQIVSECPEVTGGEEKLPCESDQMGPYPEAFTLFDADFVTINDNSFSVLGATSDDSVKSADNYLEPDKYYFIKYTVSGWLFGSVGPVNGTQQTANGTYSEVVKIGSDGKLQFDYKALAGTATMNVSNIFIACVRYSQLYEFVPAEESSPTISFSGQTKFCISGSNLDDRFKYRDPSVFKNGQTYRVCINITGVIGDDGINIIFGTITQAVTTLGYHCFDLVYDSTGDIGLQIQFSDLFDGCIEDITVNLIAEIRIGLFDENGDEVTDALETEDIGNTIKVTLADDTPPGCYQVGVADNCSNFKHQFYGNVLDVERESETVDLITGNFSVTPGESGQFSVSITFKNAVCCGKTYGASVTLSLAVPVLDGALSITNIGVGGEFDGTGPWVLNFSNAIAECPEGNGDLTMTFSGHIDSGEGPGPFVGSFNLEDLTTVTMNADQFCPELWSVCIKVMETAPCDTVLVKYRNPNDAFGFDYTSDGYKESDNFYNQFRVNAKVWHPNYPKTKSIQKNSNGRRTLFYSDVDKKFKFTTAPLPYSTHDALSIALEHQTLIIGEGQFVCESEEYAPEPNKASDLSPVEVELFIQQPRMVNTLC